MTAALPSRRSIALSAFCALQAADCITTVMVFHAGGYEANPVARAMFPLLGTIPSLIVFKLLCCFGATRLRHERLIYAAVCIYACIVGWNSFLLVMRGVGRL